MLINHIVLYAPKSTVFKLFKSDYRNPKIVVRELTPYRNATWNYCLLISNTLFSPVTPFVMTNASNEGIIHHNSVSVIMICLQSELSYHI